nr:hypothetical protein CFP56_74575 [Quercus suber]
MLQPLFLQCNCRQPRHFAQTVNKCTLENTPLSSGNFGTYLKDFGLDNCDVIVGIFIPEVTPIANASFFEVEATANNNMELQ